MNRRDFNKSLVSAAAFLALRSVTGCSNKNIMDRVAMSTVNFRERFAATQLPGSPRNEPMLLLQDIPGYFADRFHLHNVEFWSKHFESIEPVYLKELAASIKKSNSRLINIQFDEDYQVGSPDETIRKQSLELALKWVDVAKTLNAGCIRVNPGNGDVNYAIESLKIINKAAKEKGLILMVENHFGMEMDPDVHVRIVKEAGANTYTLPDFGNYSDDVRYDALKKIMPYAYQISAKTILFDENMNHLSFDFDKCMQIAVENNFKGIYSVEQWNPGPVSNNEEAMADWMIEKVKNYL